MSSSPQRALPSPARTGSAQPALKLRVTAAAERHLRSGHPWVYEDSITKQNRSGPAGELAVVYDPNNRFLALGLYDPDSVIRIRILHVGAPRVLDAAWWDAHLLATVARRTTFLEDPQTSGFRLIHGENDGWPGLVLDRYDETLVLKLYSAIWLPLLEAVVERLGRLVPHRRIVLRLSRNLREQIGVAGAEGAVIDGAIVRGEALDAPIVFLETGLRFEADVLRGQKTGFFLDQRENRRRVESYAAKCDGLNVFSFTGGFSIYAARGGARSVTDLDISPHALAGAKRNVLLNRDVTAVTSCRHETIQANAFDWLAQETSRQFDLVVLDPPSLARRESERQTAIQSYQRLARAGIAKLRPRGLLVASSCSAHVTTGEFVNAVLMAARGSGRRFATLEQTGHPLDHTPRFREAEYLKCLYLRFAD